MPVQDRFKQTTGNFDGLSPTDFTHFDFPPNGVPRVPMDRVDSYDYRYKTIP